MGGGSGHSCEIIFRDNKLTNNYWHQNDRAPSILAFLFVLQLPHNTIHNKTLARRNSSGVPPAGLCQSQHLSSTRLYTLVLSGLGVMHFASVLTSAFLLLFAQIRATSCGCAHPVARREWYVITCSLFICLHRRR